LGRLMRLCCWERIHLTVDRWHGFNELTSTSGQPRHRSIRRTSISKSCRNIAATLRCELHFQTFPWLWCCKLSDERSRSYESHTSSSEWKRRGSVPLLGSAPPVAILRPCRQQDLRVRSGPPGTPAVTRKA